MPHNPRRNAKLWLMACQQPAAPTGITSRGTATATSSTTLTIPNVTVASGESLVFGFATDGSATLNVLSISWNSISGTNVYNQSNGVNLANSMWYWINPGAGTHNLLLTIGTAANIVGWATSFTYNVGSGAVEWNYVNSGNPSGTAVTANKAGSASAPPTFYSFGLAWSGPPSDGAPTWGNSIVNGQMVGLSTVTAQEGRLLASGAAPSSISATLNVSRSWFCQGQTFKQS
jgi:hypothetical protein